MAASGAEVKPFVGGAEIEGDDIAHCSCNRGFLYDHDSPEAAGYILTGGSRGSAAIFTAIYTSLGIVLLAEAAAECGVLFGGPAISSMVPIILTIESVLVTVCSLLFGSGINRSPHRRWWFLAMNIAIQAQVVIQIGLVFWLGEASFVIFSLSALAVAVFYELAVMVHNAYLPEVGKDDLEVAIISSKTYMLLNTMQVVYIVVVTGATLAVASFEDPTETQLSIAIAGVIEIILWIPLMKWGYKLLEERPDVPEEALIKPGFLGIGGMLTSFKEVVKKYPSIGKALLGYSLGGAAVQTFLALVTSYLRTEVGLATFQITVLSALTLLIAVPGAYVAGRIVKRTNPKWTMMLTMVLWFICGAGTPLIIYGKPSAEFVTVNSTECEIAEDVVNREPAYEAINFIIYILGLYVGLCIGLFYTVWKSLFSAIVPGVNEKLYWSLGTAAFASLAWAPPALFTAINEGISDQRLALGVMAVFYVAAFLAFGSINMEQAKADIVDTLQYRKKHEAISKVQP